MDLVSIQIENALRGTDNPARDSALRLIHEKLPDVPQNASLRATSVGFINFLTANQGNRIHNVSYQTALTNQEATMLSAFKEAGRLQEGIQIRRRIKDAVKEIQNEDSVIYLGKD